MSYIKHAKREMRKWLKSKDKMSRQAAKDVIELLMCLSRQGHSGFSAPIVINLFAKLAKFEPLGPLTGRKNEWNKIGEDLWQNNRCSHVFKNKTESYDIDGIIFVDPNGAHFTNSTKSRVKIKFPYVPTSKIVKVDKNGKPIKTKRSSTKLTQV